MNTVLVTGSTGFLGQSLIGVLCLRKDIQRIYLHGRSESKLLEISQKYAQQAEDNNISLIPLCCELSSLSQHQAELLTSDYIFHTAANPSFKAVKSELWEANVESTRLLVEQLSQANRSGSARLKNFIFVSSIGAVDRSRNDSVQSPISIKSTPAPRSAYGESKLIGEKIVQSSAIPFTIIRPAWVYGKDMRDNSHLAVMAQMVEKNALASHFDFPGRVSVIHVTDLALALSNCIEQPAVIGCIYFASTESLSIGRIFSLYRNRPVLSFGLSAGLIAKAISQVHMLLPISINNLFLSYLEADDQEFKQKLLKGRTISFTQAHREIKDRYRDNGYWLITGANSGIGLEIAKICLRDKRPMILVDRDTTHLEFLFSNVESHCVILKVDLSDLHDFEQIKDAVGNKRIGVLINNAGIGVKGTTDSLSTHQIEMMIKVNCAAPIHLYSQLKNQLKASRSVVVNIASSVSGVPLPGMSIYAASKAFMDSWSCALAAELHPMNPVITILPAGTNTNFQNHAGVKKSMKQGLLNPIHVATRIYDASVQRRSKRMLIGRSAWIMALMGRVLPRYLLGRILLASFAKAR